MSSSILIIYTGGTIGGGSPGAEQVCRQAGFLHLRPAHRLLRRRAFALDLPGAAHPGALRGLRRICGPARDGHHGLQRLHAQFHAGRPGQTGGIHRQPAAHRSAAHRREGEPDIGRGNCRRQRRKRACPRAGSVHFLRLQTPAGQPLHQIQRRGLQRLRLPQLPAPGRGRHQHPLQYGYHPQTRVLGCSAAGPDSVGYECIPASPRR